MIKVIASDMDGTLLCDDHRIAPDTIAAVKEACAAGIRFMVATGRGYEGAMAELDGTGIDNGVDLILIMESLYYLAQPESASVH